MQDDRYNTLLSKCTARDYKGFQEDEELRSFFHKFSEYVKKELDSEIEKQEKDNNIIRPNFDTLSLLISQLENLGIITNKTYLLTSGFYKSSFYLDELKKIKFNEMFLDNFDLDFLEKKYKNSEEKFKAISNVEQQYKLWIKENKGIDKKIQRAEEKVKKLAKEEEKKYKDASISRWLASRSEYSDSVFEMRKLQREKERGLSLNQKMNFINSATKEQALLIIELCSEVIKIEGQYRDYEDKIEIINLNIREKFSEICEMVFNNIIKTSLVEINLNNFDRKIFKIKLTNFLMEINANSTKYDFDTSVVDWFVESRKENLIELFKITCSDLDEMLKEHSEKVLKK